jgi:hypothetical protein
VNFDASNGEFVIHSGLEEKALASAERERCETSGPFCAGGAGGELPSVDVGNNGHIRSAGAGARPLRKSRRRPDIDMKYQVIQRQRMINGHRGPILEIELFTDEDAARERAGALRDSNPEHIVSLRRIGCVISDAAQVAEWHHRVLVPSATGSSTLRGSRLTRNRAGPFGDK